MSYAFTNRTDYFHATINSCKFAGFSEALCTNPYFNLLFTVPTCTKVESVVLNKYQKVNHFPQANELRRKDRLWKNIKRMRTNSATEYDIHPFSYTLKDEYDAFEKARKQDPDQLWILKPSAGTCGKAIHIINNMTKIPDHVREADPIVGKYINNPHLINGFKYDLRIYVLVTSYTPLKIYIYNQGLVRFCTMKYSNDPKTRNELYMHLTNYSINKDNENFVENQGQGDGTSKWDFRLLKKCYESLGIDYDHMQERIRDVIIKTLISVEPHVNSTVNERPTLRANCYCVYGFDIMIDDQLKPWLIEVNVAPSLASSSPLDKRVKTMLMCDTLTLIGIRPYQKAKVHGMAPQEMQLGPFEQSMTLEKLQEKGKFDGTEKLTEDEMEMFMDLEDENKRRGNFDKAYPLESNVNFYA